jgi:hypothetical protein
VLRGFRQFDAPVCVIITYDRVLDGSDDTPFDCGAVATALVLKSSAPYPSSFAASTWAAIPWGAASALAAKRA